MWCGRTSPLKAECSCLNARGGMKGFYNQDNEGMGGALGWLMSFVVKFVIWQCLPARRWIERTLGETNEFYTAVLITRLSTPCHVWNCVTLVVRFVQLILHQVVQSVGFFSLFFFLTVEFSHCATWRNNYADGMTTLFDDVNICSILEGVESLSIFTSWHQTWMSCTHSSVVGECP